MATPAITRPNATVPGTTTDWLSSAARIAAGGAVAAPAPVTCRHASAYEELIEAEFLAAESLDTTPAGAGAAAAGAV
jgi:hypothetical protein